MSKQGEKTRSSIHHAAMRAAGAIRLTVKSLKKDSESPLRIDTIQAEATHIVGSASRLDFEVSVRTTIEEAAKDLLADLVHLDPEQLLQHLAKMEFVSDLTAD